MRVRIAIVAVLFVAPFVGFAAAGAYHFWFTGWTTVASFTAIGCFALAYGLAWVWTRRGAKVLPAAGPTEPLVHWTDRDRSAWKLVEEQANAVTRVTIDDVSDVRKYAADAQTMALAVARVYQPAAADPVGHLTLPEILACVELVAQDLTELVGKYVPGSHLIRLNDLGQVQRAADWYTKTRNAYWLASAVLDPIRTGFQVAATRLGVTAPWQKLRENVLHWFYTAYLRELGRYLIELNSGRLKVGVKRYRELMGGAVNRDSEEPVSRDAESSERSGPSPITLAVIGQVKAGKSSLVNALLGEQRAAADALPTTAGVTRYQLTGPAPLDLLDTAGYGQGGTDDTAAAQEAVETADLVLYVAPARGAARAADLAVLDRFAESAEKAPHLRRPPVVLVLTHIDLLTPATEWAPPYDWQGSRPKEESVREACAAATEVFGKRVESVVPVCTASGREYGVRTDLLAAIAGLLGEARGVAMLKTLHAEAEAGQARKVVGQVVNVGREAFRALWDRIRT
jgi:predicted GTPase